MFENMISIGDCNAISDIFKSFEQPNQLRFRQNLTTGVLMNRETISALSNLTFPEGVILNHPNLHVRNLGLHRSILVKCGVYFDPLTVSLTQLQLNYICMSTSATAHLFVDICSLPLVHRPKGVLLVVGIRTFRLTTPYSPTLVKEVSSRSVGSNEM